MPSGTANCQENCDQPAGNDFEPGLAVGVELVEEAFGAVGFADAHERLNLQAIRDDQGIEGIDAKGEGVLASPTGTVLQVRRNEIEGPETAARGVGETSGAERHGEAGNSL